jgi:hypothetical protein
VAPRSFLRTFPTEFAVERPLNRLEYVNNLYLFIDYLRNFLPLTRYVDDESLPLAT